MLNTENLTKMRALIEDLERDQDQSIPEALCLIEDYLPLSASVWRVCCKDAVVFTKGNGIIDEHATSLESLFTVIEGKQEILEAHRKAFDSEPCSILINENGRTFSIKLVPEADESRTRFVTGFAIDVSDVVRGLKGNGV
jgi:hypothetical protein